MDARKYLAELVGTFILVVVGSMSIVSAGAMSAPVLLVAPFGFGLGLLAAIQSAGYVSAGISTRRSPLARSWTGESTS